MKVLLPFFAMIFATASYAQQPLKCATTQAIDFQESLQPGYKNAVNAAFEKAKGKGSSTNKSEVIYTIPVVVHVVYNSAEQNLHDSIIQNQIQVLNEDYNRMNADTVNMRSDFEIVKGSPQIEFVLASVDPDGNPTTGITRTSTATTSFGSFFLLFGDFSDVEKVKSTANGGIDPWDQSRYLNIWVCNMAISFGGQETPAVLGYATPPADLPNWPAGSTVGLSDGVVLQYQTVGRNNPNALDVGQGPIEVLGRTASHEVGHYLGLRHIWGDGDCTQQDGIDDTPNADAQSDFDCDITKNTCVDNIQGVDLPDMIENFMDYSAESCQNSFTAGQVALIHGVLEDDRYDLVHDNNASISVNSLEIGAKIYPVPATDKIELTHTNNAIVTLKIVALNGQKMLEKETIQSTEVISLTEFKSGVYFLHLSTIDGKSEVLKFVKL